MKNRIINIGKATLYFGAYFGMQIIVSFVFTFIFTVYLTVEMMSGGSEPDNNLLLTQVTNVVNEQTMMLVMISGVLTIGIFSLVFLVKKKNILEGISVKRFKLVSVIPLILLGAALNIFISLLLGMIPFPESWINSYQDSSSMLTEGNYFIAVIATAFIAPVVEELTFRVLIYTRLKRAMSSVIAAVITSLIFGIVHGSIVWCMYAFVLSIVLIWIFERFDSVLANITVHIAFNALGILLSGTGEISDITGWILLISSAIIAVISFVWIYNITKLRDCYIQNENNEQLVYS